MARAYAYVRYSSMKQREGDTVERQVTPLEAFTEDTGVAIAETFFDEGVSSFRGNNAKFGELKVILDRIKSGELRHGDYLVVESIDRITRQKVFDGVELLSSILKSGVRIYTTTDKKTYSLDDSAKHFETLMMISLIAQRANEESETKSDRRKKKWRSAKRLAVEKGKVFNKHNPPYGIRYCEDSQRFVLDEKQAEEVRKIFELLKVTGVSNVIRIVNQTSERRWTNKAINVLLRSQYPRGVMMSQKRGDGQKKVFIEFIEGYYPAIVTNTQFNEAIAAMQSRRTRKEYGNSTIGNLNVFRHVVKCGSCGESFVFEKQRNQKGELYYYFNCKTRKEHKGDCVQRFRYDLAFGMLLRAVSLLSPAKKIMTKPIAINLPEEIERLIRKEGDIRLKAMPEVSRNRGVIAGTIAESPEQKQIRLRMRKFGDDLFSKIMNHAGATSKLENKLDNAKEKLARLQMTLDNLNENMNAMIDENVGRIPRALLDKIGSVEQERDDQQEIVDALGVEVSEMSVTIPIASAKDLIEKFQTEEGRLQLNGFFKKQKVVFSFEFDQEVRRLDMTVSQNGEVVWKDQSYFGLHKPLSQFGISKLEDVMSSE
ncbi:recombinase family protein [Pseudomonas sp. NBRC 111125]|uniref:recombinase family protein n=1 Tax=Pseudomonas sp. NBRC 111125 TaxID=1661040 RepID=UPI000760C098|nr:recombinase family protein [Pseudomonas sp. NBRC 111125]